MKDFAIKRTGALRIRHARKGKYQMFMFVCISISVVWESGLEGQDGVSGRQDRSFDNPLRVCPVNCMIVRFSKVARECLED